MGNWKKSDFYGQFKAMESEERLSIKLHMAIYDLCLLLAAEAALS